MPPLLAGFGIERNQVIVGRLKVQPVFVHTEAAVPDVGTTLGLPEVVPQHRSVAGVDGPGIVWYRDIKNPVHLQDRAGDAPGAAYGNRFINFAAHDRRWVPGTGSGKRSRGGHSGS